MNAAEIIEQLKTLGSESTKKVLVKHGAKEPFFGVKIDELKKIQKKIKKNHALSLELYDTGISDAMYLAGLIADETKMTREEIQNWAEKAYWSMLSEYSVAWVASESNYGQQLAKEWIESDKENIAAAGWATLSSLVAIKPDAEIDLEEYKMYLIRVEDTIQQAPNRVRYTMNGFVIAVGSYVTDLTEVALNTAKRIGAVKVKMGDTACNVPFAPDYINKVISMGKVGKKRKAARC